MYGADFCTLHIQRRKWRVDNRSPASIDLNKAIGISTLLDIFICALYRVAKLKMAVE